MRFTLVAIFSVLIATHALAQKETASQTENEASLEKLLEKRISVDIKEQENSEFVKVLKKAGFNIQIHQSAMDAGLGPDDLISIKFEDTRLRTVLELFLENYDATYRIKDNQLILMTKDEAQNHLRVKVFQCRDILAKIKPKRIRSLKAAKSLGGPGGGFGNSRAGGAKFNLGIRAPKQQDDAKKQSKATQKSSESKKSDKDSADEVPKDDPYFYVSPAEQLIELIETTIDPDSWESTEGLGTIRELNGLIIVAQTESTLGKIDRLLAQLRK